MNALSFGKIFDKLKSIWRWFLRSNEKKPKYSGVKSKNNKIRRIIFLCPASNKPIGGIKVIYNQSSIIKSNTEFDSQVLHPFDLDFSCDWFDNSVSFKRDLEFDVNSDFVLIPEVWVNPHAKLLRDIGVRYGIYVQNGYSMHFRNYEGLSDDYRESDLILAISDDSVECIKTAFPECANKVKRMHYSINRERFFQGTRKEKIISYMPRKLKKHSDLVLFFLGKHLPSDWTVMPIDGVSERGVIEILAKTSIFLSFSEFEGCPLPPVEAAMCGCDVIGYTGEGGREYWSSELFTEIHSGAIIDYVSAILKKIEQPDLISPEGRKLLINQLALKYSPDVELMDIKVMINTLNRILEP